MQILSISELICWVQHANTVRMKTVLSSSDIAQF